MGFVVFCYRNTLSMSFSRRRALSLLAAGISLPVALGGLTVAGSGRAAAPSGAGFHHGVASGDPLADAVVLWTRVTPALAAGPVAVSWEVAADAAFTHIVDRGVAEAMPDRDHTVKVDVRGLKPGRDHWYRFHFGGMTSPVGRTRTLPTGAQDRVVMAFVSCALYPNGYFNAYDHIARLDRVDVVVELGDYIYEYGAAEGDYGMASGRRLGRIPEPAHDIVTLADYRTRYAQYRRDPDLQAAHARAPWICVWDDHEVANDTWVGGAENHHEDRQGRFLDREAAAVRAYYEWMPIREPAPGRAAEAIYRSFQFGDLASLIMVESRLLARSYQLELDRSGDIPMTVWLEGAGERHPVTDPAVLARVMAAAKAGEALPAAPQADARYALGPDEAALKAYVANPERQMLGTHQEQWLAGELAASVAAGRPWQVLGNQVVMARTIAPKMEKALGRDGLEQWLARFPEPARTRVAELVRYASFDVPFDLDGWDGYPAARERVYDAIKGATLKKPAGAAPGQERGANTIIVSGDSHAFWVNELRDAGGQTRVAAEFGTSSITSPSPGDELGGIQLGPVFVDQNPEVKFCDQLAKGYVLLTLTPEKAVADLVSVDIHAKPYTASVLGSWQIRPTPGTGVAAPERV